MANIFCAIGAHLGTATVRHDQEFLSSIAADGVIGAHRITKTASYFTQNFVAGSVAICVIHFLEVIDVAQNYGQFAFFAIAARA